MTYKTSIPLCAAVLAAGLLLAAGCSPAKAPQEEIPLVSSLVVQSGSSGGSAVYSGEVRGRYEKQLAFQIGGKIIRRNVDPGSSVNAGDELMAIDPKDVVQTANISAAQVSSAEAQLTLAENNLTRFRRLYEEDAISRAQLDQYQSAYDAAVAAARQASAQQAQGANQLSYSTLHADSAGVIAAVNVEAGQVVGAGQAVLTLVADGEREIEINVPENRIAEVRQAARIDVSFWALPGVAASGTVREIAPMADKVTRTYKVRISLVNPPPEVKLGMTATVTVALPGSRPAAFIPLSALYQTGSAPSVWVVRDGAVQLQPVRIGRFGDNAVEVLDGLQPGDVVVTKGVHKLQPGQKVRTDGDRS